jgi:sugar O-acyltransferase (sialic acid O-acetyltransferase NeuD family)
VVPPTEPSPRAGAPIVVYGGGGHGITLIDALRAIGTYDVAGVIDGTLAPGSSVLGVAVLGGPDVLGDVRAGGIELAVNAVGSLRDLGRRAAIFDELTGAGFRCPTVTHPSAVVDASAEVDDGVHVLAHAYVGAAAAVGFGSVVNTGAVVSHGCRIGACVNISPGALLAGDVTIGDRALVGMGANVNIGLGIGAGARVGNGAIVKADVPEGGVVRAGEVWG